MRTPGRVVTYHDDGTEEWSVWMEGDCGQLVSKRGLSKDDAEHLAACWNAIEDVGGDPAVVREMVAIVRRIASHFEGTDAPLGADAHAVLARLGGGA